MVGLKKTPDGYGQVGGWVRGGVITGLIAFEVKETIRQAKQNKDPFPIYPPRRVGFLGLSMVSCLISTPGPSGIGADTSSKQFLPSFVNIQPCGAALWTKNLRWMEIYFLGTVAFEMKNTFVHLSVVFCSSYL